MSIIVRQVDTDDEWRRATDLFVRAHHVDSPATLKWLREGSQQYPNYRREHTFVLHYDGQLASALRLTTDIILLGEARLKMGGIGWVSTEQCFRGKGFSTRLIQETMNYMRLNNYHVSILFGIPNFYERLGYVTALVDYLVEIDTVEALTFNSSLSLRLARPTDIPVLQRIHAHNNTNIACSILRTASHFKNKWDSWHTWYCLTDEKGKVEAYFIAHRDGPRLLVDDVGISETRFCSALLRAAAQLAAEEGANAIAFYIPPVHPLARYLLQFRSRHEMRVERNAGGMMALVNPLETFENMIPEWETLLASNRLTDLRTEFTLCLREDMYRFRVNRGVVDVAAVSVGKNKITLSWSDLIYLICGYLYPRDIIEFSQARITPEAEEVFSTLFPKRVPYIWRFDRF